jgi:hypothetical protein
MIFLNNKISSAPVGLVKFLKPEGHSGHLRLQDVVGSIDKEMGKPLRIGLLFFLET